MKESQASRLAEESRAANLPRRLSVALLLMAMAAGVYLRSQQLSAQWLTDDEWHAVHKVLSGATYAEIALSVGGADFSIPQTLLYKWLASSVGIDELGMRAPMLIAGIGLVGGGGWWAWRSFCPMAGWSFALLLAISPLLVNFSRTARPYALTVLLAWVALLALERWREERSVESGAVFGVAAVLACWLHAVVAPFILLPFAWLCCEDVLRARRARSWRPLGGAAALGAAVALGVALLVALPMLLGRTALTSRLGTDLPTLDTLVGVWFVWLGIEAPWLVGVCLVLAVIGGRDLARRRPVLLGLAGIGAVAVLTSIYLARPAWVHVPLTFGRYLLPVQPLLLLCVALGLCACVRRLPWIAARPAVVVLLPGLLLAAGPTYDLLAAPNNFTLHAFYQVDYRTERNPFRSGFARAPESPFWHELAALPAGSVHVAAAGHGLESYTLFDVRWQRIHRQVMWNAQRGGYCGEPPYWAEVTSGSGFHFRNAVELASPDSLRAARIDYVVFNHNVMRMNVADIAPCIERFRREYGEPAYMDDYVVAFRLPKED